MAITVKPVAGMLAKDVLETIGLANEKAFVSVEI